MKLRFLLVGCVLSLVNSVHAEDRFALLIGNSNYQSEKADKLANPVKDVDAVEKSLKALGFTVTKKKDLNYKEMQEAIIAFNAQLTPKSVALFFFAGHGLQLQNKNYLVPVDAKLRAEFEVKTQCVLLEYVLDALSLSRSNLNIVLLDCCRTNPFARGWNRNIGGSGLAAVNVPKGTLVAFSTAPGEVAKDGADGANSPFTKSLVKVLNTRPVQGLEVVRALRLTSQDVYRQTKRKQSPWLSAFQASLGDYYFWAPGKAPMIPVPPMNMRNTLIGKTPGQLWDKNSLKMNFRWCPPGTFQMGSPQNAKYRNDNEDQVTVKLSQGFWLGETEVTQAQWQQVMNTKPWQGKKYVKNGANYPAVYISHTDATEFCGKLTAIGHQEGWLPKEWSITLPTEAEWEYACRAGTSTAYSFGDEIEDLGLYAWFDGNAWDIGEKYAHEVGAKKPNPWNLSDMHGNVNEWCRDWYGNKLPGGTDPAVLEQGEATRRVKRGGGWQIHGASCRSARRNTSYPETGFEDFGFRVTISSTR